MRSFQDVNLKTYFFLTTIQLNVKEEEKNQKELWHLSFGLSVYTQII